MIHPSEVPQWEIPHTIRKSFILKQLSQCLRGTCFPTGSFPGNPGPPAEGEQKNSSGTGQAGGQGSVRSWRCEVRAGGR